MYGFPSGIAFLLGLSSTLHCWGMCGGIISAFSLTLPASVRTDRARSLSLIAACNLGRVLSYTLGGAAAGTIGAAFGATLAGGHGHLILQILAGTVLTFTGLHLAGWLPRLVILERAGMSLWRRLQPLGRRLLPPDTAPRAFGMGMIWGMLPCALVYAALLWSSASASGPRGAFWMFCFGLGTVPGMFAAGALARPLGRPARLRRLAGAVIALFGVAWLVLPFTPLHALLMPETLHVH